MRRKRRKFVKTSAPVSEPKRVLEAGKEGIKRRRCNHHQPGGMEKINRTTKIEGVKWNWKREEGHLSRRRVR